MIPFLLRFLREDDKLSNISFCINELFIVLLQEKVMSEIFYTQSTLKENHHFLMHVCQEVNIFYQLLEKEVSKRDYLSYKEITSFIANYYKNNKEIINSNIESRMEILVYKEEYYLELKKFIENYFNDCCHFLIESLKECQSKQDFLKIIKQYQQENEQKQYYYDKYIEITGSRNFQIKEFFESGQFTTEVNSLSSYIVHRKMTIPKLLSVSEQENLAENIIKHFEGSLEEKDHIADVIDFLNNIKKELNKKYQSTEALEACLIFLEKNYSKFEKNKSDQLKNTIVYCLANHPDFNMSRNIFGRFFDYIESEESNNNTLISLIESRYRFKTLFLPTKTVNQFETIYKNELIKAAKEGNTSFMVLLLIPIYRKRNIELRHSINNIIMNYCKGFSLEINYIFHEMVLSYFLKNTNLEFIKKELFENINTIHSQVICQLNTQYRLELMLYLQEFSLLEKFDRWFIREGERIVKSDNLYLKIIELNKIKNLFKDIYNNPSLPSLSKIQSFLQDEIKSAKALFFDNIKERKELLQDLQSKFKSSHAYEVKQRLETLSLYTKEVYSLYEPFKYIETMPVHTFGLNKDLTVIKGEIADKDSPLQASEFLLDFLFNVFIDPKDVFDDQGNSLLHVAAASRQVTAAALCVMNGLSWHSKNGDNRDVLSYADLTKKDPFYLEVMYIVIHKSTHLSKNTNAFLLQYQDLVLYRKSSLSRSFISEILSYLSSEYRENEKLCDSDREMRFCELKRAVKNAKIQMNDRELQHTIDKMYAEIADMPKGLMGMSFFAQGIRSIILQRSRSHIAITGTEVPMLIFIKTKLEEKAKSSAKDKGKQKEIAEPVKVLSLS